ncbi:MAG: T9SS type A sorting domain-containing protein [Balneolales bacterium]
MKQKACGIITFSLFILFQNIHAQDNIYLPDSLSLLKFGTHICGTMILHGIPDLAEDHGESLNFKQNSLSQMVQSADASVGDLREFYVFNYKDSDGGITQEYDEIDFELSYIDDVVEIWVEKDELKEGKITQEIVDTIMDALVNKTPEGSYDRDRGIININKKLFGDPPNVNNSDRVKILLVDIQDGWDPDNGGGFIAGFFNPNDLNPALPTNNSNEADIIYIDTYPGIYHEDQPADPLRSLNTVAHEYQHLIHANYGHLITFQNEAQSEIAEVINGYNARNMAYLNDKEEISGNVTSGSGSGLYRWRRSDMHAVLLDYQRAGLLHGYLNERVGAEATARITKSKDSGKNAYISALSNAGIDWPEFLADFYVANLINNPELYDNQFGYSNPKFSNVGATGYGRIYPTPEENPGEKEVSITYGGAIYTKWQNTTNLRLNISDDGGIWYYAVTRPKDATSDRVEKLDKGSTTFSGSFDFITLVAVNIKEKNDNEENPGSRGYSYSTSNTGDNKPLVSKYKLVGNYPNPFNPTTTIQYNLPETAHVRIEIYDIKGRKIKTLLNKTQDEGSHYETFKARNLASGVYLYQLQAGDYVQIKKMMLVK